MPDKKRLIWLTRRGIREMDLLFKQYIKEHYDQLTDEQLLTLESLLNEADLDIMDWIIGRREPSNPDYLKVLNEMQSLKNKQPDEN